MARLIYSNSCIT